MASKAPRSLIRREVHNFLLAAERLLAPTLQPKLSPEECHLICEYLTTMSRADRPWSGHFKSTVSGQSQSAPVDRSSRGRNYP
jgi:hypothetical protein